MKTLVLQPSEPAPGSREWLTRRTEFIVSLAYRQVCDIIRIGAELTEVKRVLGHGRYEQWAKERLPFSYPTANRYRQVAKAFAQYQSCQFDNFEPSALYLLAQPKGVTKAVRDHAVQLAEQGQRITHTTALEIIDANRPVNLSEKDIKRYEKVRKQLDARRVVTTVGRGGNERQEVEYIDPAAATEAERAREDRTHARIGKLFLDALKQYTRVEFQHIPGDAAEDDDPETMFCVTGYSRDEAVGTRVKSQCDPRLLLESLLGVVSKKHCAGCCAPLAEIPLDRFCRNRNLEDGRNARCRACEKKRKEVYRAKRKEGEGATGDA